MGQPVTSTVKSREQRLLLSENFTKTMRNDTKAEIGTQKRGHYCDRPTALGPRELFCVRKVEWFGTLCGKSAASCGQSSAGCSEVKTGSGGPPSSPSFRGGSDSGRNLASFCVLRPLVMPSPTMTDGFNMDWSF